MTMREKLIAFISATALIVLTNIPFPYQSEKDYEIRLLRKEEKKNEIYWDLSCPWEMTHLSVTQQGHQIFDDPEYLSRPGAQTREEFIRSAEVSREYSLSHQTPSRFRNKAGALKGRRTLLVGDSLTRQLFVSMACLLPEDMIAAHVTPWTFDQEHVREFFDSRIQLKDSGEIFYSPRAGGINEYNWVAHLTGGWEPIKSTGHDWIQSCRERKPFKFVANEIPLDYENRQHGSKKVEYEKGDTEYDLITLNKNDVVVIGAGVHIPRPENLQNLEELLDCMEQAQKEEEGNIDWPHIVYFKTSMKHYADEMVDGFFVCQSTNYHKEDESYEIKTFGDRMFMLGRSMDYSELGYLHVHGKTPDCTHWLQPGLPDVQAVELINHVAEFDSISHKSKGYASTLTFN